MTNINNKRLSVVLSACNESAGIQTTIRTLDIVLKALPYEFELIVVDDGSSDRTYERAAEMAAAGFAVRAIRLSRNSGKEAALLEGLQQARGDAVITIDADLRHPPALIPGMVAAWEHGAKVVNGVKRSPGNKHWWVAARAKIVKRNASDFKLLDRAAVEVVTQELKEHRRSYRKLTDRIGFSQTTLQFDVAPRQHARRV